MSRGLRTLGTVAGVVAGVALIGTGIGAALGGTMMFTALGGAGIAASSIASVAGAVSALANVAGGATAGKPGIQGNISDITIGNNLPIPYAMGRTYVGGNLDHDVGYGGTVDDVKNPYRSMVLVWSGGGPIQGIEAFQADFATVSFSGGAATGYYAGYMWLATQLGACPEAAALAGPFGSFSGWGSAHKLSGYAAGLVTLKFDKSGKQYSAGVPKLGAIVNGVLAYDPRLDDTYPGGAGAHRALVETTYAGTDNPGLHGPTYAMGRWQNGKKAFGIGMPPDSIDWPAWVDFANVCEANGWKVGGAVYEGPGISRWDNLKRICEAGGGVPVFVGAKLSVKFNSPKVALDTIGLDDLADGEIIIPATKGWKDKKNSLVPFCRSEAHRWEYVDSDAVTVPEYVTADGELKTGEFKPQLVQDKDQSAQLAGYELVNSREIGPIVLPLKPRFIEYRIGEAFEVGDDLAEETGLPAGSLLMMTGREIDPATASILGTFETETTSKHAFALGREGTVPPLPSLIDPEDLDDVIGSNDLPAGALVLAIQNSFIPDPGANVIAADVGATATVTIDNHTRQYTDKLVSVTGDVIEGLPFTPTGGPTVWKYIAYDDPDRAGGVVTYTTYDTPEEAGPSPTNPGRHFVGGVPMPEDGGTATGGSTGGPPWWKFSEDPTV